MKKDKIYRIGGALLILIAIVGFLTVADDFRHTGELWGTGSLLGAGVFLFLAGHRLTIFNRLALQWIALGLVAAIPIGALLDSMPLGFAICALLGAVAAYLRGSRRTKVRE